MTLEQLQTILIVGIKNNASDLHIRTNERPCFRIRGELTPIKMDIVTPTQIRALCDIISKISSKQFNVDNGDDFDGAFEIPKVCRVRFNIFKYLSQIGIVMRLINSTIKTITDLGLPEIIRTVALKQHGLILVTGATGTGKSSTLAAMINEINNTSPLHILTLEDPVEFIHKPIKARITQREIGTDCPDFIVALKGALRQDPDVILIGEMRDSATMDIALKAAETGHVVFATMHTTNALTTIGRLISMFPADEQNNVRGRLADNLTATIGQRLLTSKDEAKRIPALEVMITGPGIKDCIKGKEDLTAIYNYIERGFKDMQSMSFDQYITHLFRNDLVTFEEAKKNASSPENFERNIMFSDQ